MDMQFNIHVFKGVQKLPVMIINRMLALCKHIKSLLSLLDGDILQKGGAETFAELVQQHHSFQGPRGQTIPLPLFSTFSELTEELTFLRRLHQHTRKQHEACFKTCNM